MKALHLPRQTLTGPQVGMLMVLVLLGIGSAAITVLVVRALWRFVWWGMS